MKSVERVCPACGGKKLFRLDCKTCGCGGSHPFKKELKTEAKILLLDIETMANLGWVWRIYDTSVIEVHQHGYILSFACKWTDEDRVIVRGLDDYPNFKKDGPFPEARSDKDLLIELSGIMNQADIIVAHNGKAFDLLAINTRLMVHGLPPIRASRTFDTLQEIRKNAKFVSNKLDHLAQELNLGRKMAHSGFGLWLRCAQGDPEAWKMMKRYNKHDVRLLEELYYRLRPFSKKHPNVNQSLGKCRKCGSINLKQDGFVYTNYSRKARLYCYDCKGWQEEAAKRMH